MSKAIKNPILFMAGNPISDFPTAVFMTYDVVNTRNGSTAKKVDQAFEVVDPDPNRSIEDIWNECVNGIKANEGIA